MRTAAVAGLLAVLAAACAPPPAAPGDAALAAPCARVLLVTARGSGDPPDSAEVAAMEAGLRDRLGRRAVRAVELGDLDDDGVIDPGGYPAPAAAAAFGFDPDADSSAGDLLLLGGYNTGRRIGSAELARLLVGRAERCPRERIVLSGYSMGAHAVAVGTRALPGAVRDRVDAVALFGDPTLVVGPWLRAPAAEFPTGTGLLGGRHPYVADDLAARTTSWCGWADPYCTGQPAWLLLRPGPCPPTWPACTRTHEDYPSWAIPAAMATAAAAVAGPTAG